jgi:hypothetical protein
MLSTLPVFVQAVLGHLVTILAGCGATVVLELIRRFVLKREFPNRWYLWFLAVFLVFAFFQAWQDEYLSALARSTDLHRQQYATSRQEERTKIERDQKQTCLNELNIVRGVLEGQTSQISGQQGTLSTCILSLAKNNSPEKLVITAEIAYEESLASRSPDGHKRMLSVVVAQTSKDIQPIRAILECDTEFDFAGGELVGESATFGGPINSKLGSRKASTVIDAPSWRPSHPMVFFLVSTDIRPLHCVVSQGK